MSPTMLALFWIEVFCERYNNSEDTARKIKVGDHLKALPESSLDNIRFARLLLCQIIYDQFADSQRPMILGETEDKAEFVEAQIMHTAGLLEKGPLEHFSASAEQIEAKEEVFDQIISYFTAEFNKGHLEHMPVPQTHICQSETTCWRRPLSVQANGTIQPVA